MIARIDHKNEAKKVMRGNLSSMVGANVLTAALTTITCSVVTVGMSNLILPIAIQAGTIAASAAATGDIMAILGSVVKLVLSALLSIVLGAVAGLLVASLRGVLEIGNCRYYLHLAKEGKRPGISTIFDGYNDLIGILLLYMFRSVIIFLWMLPVVILGLILEIVFLVNAKMVMFILFGILFAIAGAVISVIKSLQFSMASYIKADQVKIDARECISRSKKLTQGHILDLFIFDLTYIGWEILSSVTGSLVGLFYYVPYYRMTKAYVYAELRKGKLEVVPMDKGDIPITMTPPTISDEEYNRIKRNLIDELGLKHRADPVGIIGSSGMYQGQQFDFEPGQTVIVGRDPARSNIVISTGGEKVSGKHCSICYVMRTGEYEVVDYSSNGTLADGKKLPAGVPNSLRRGTIISLANDKNSFQLM